MSISAVLTLGALQRVVWLGSHTGQVGGDAPGVCGCPGSHGEFRFPRTAYLGLTFPGGQGLCLPKKTFKMFDYLETLT